MNTYFRFTLIADGSNIQTTNNAPSLIRKPAASASSTVTQNNQIKPTVANNNGK